VALRRQAFASRTRPPPAGKTQLRDTVGVTSVRGPPSPNGVGPCAAFFRIVRGVLRTRFAANARRRAPAVWESCALLDTARQKASAIRPDKPSEVAVTRGENKPPDERPRPDGERVRKVGIASRLLGNDCNIRFVGAVCSAADAVCRGESRSPIRRAHCKATRARLARQAACAPLNKAEPSTSSSCKEIRVPFCVTAVLGFVSSSHSILSWRPS
jgi:hypothetical protein